MNAPFKAALLSALLLGAGACTVIDPSSSSRSSGSTTPDGKSAAIDPETRVARFVEDNLDRLKQDMAVGRGEYLASLATLMQVEPARQADFFAFTQQRFPALFPSAGTSAKEMLTSLKGEMRTDPRFAQRVALN